MKKIITLLLISFYILPICSQTVNLKTSLPVNPKKNIISNISDSCMLNYNIINESPVSYSKKTKFRFTPFLKEFGMGLLLGLAIPLTAGAIVFGLGSGLWGDHEGESGSDPSTTASVIMIVGHTLGSIGGVIFQGDNESITGSDALAIIGGVIGELGSLALYINYRDKNNTALYGLASFYVIAAPLISALAYNLHTSNRDKDMGGFSLINYHNGKIAVGNPRLYLTKELRADIIKMNMNVLHVSL